MQVSNLGRHDSPPTQLLGSRVLRERSPVRRPGVRLSGVRRAEAQARALTLLQAHGYAAVHYDTSREDGWRVVNNRSRGVVEAGPLNYADAFRIAEDLNAKVTQKALQIVGAVG